MNSIVKIYSTNTENLLLFLRLFFPSSEKIQPINNIWQKIYLNPVEIADIVAAFVDNHDKFLDCNMWVSLDKSTFINITKYNYNNFIKYLFERYP